MRLMSKGAAVCIGRDHYEKLKYLYKIQAQGLKEAEELKTLNDAIFCVLVRYKMMQGGGFQAALPGCVFDVLRECFGVEMECFASPLNCRFSPFLSAFADTDATFGSLGSFFRFRPLTGSFELNPPFVGELVQRMAAHCTVLLELAEASQCALSFVIVVGASEPARAHRLLLQASSCGTAERVLTTQPYFAGPGICWNGGGSTRSTPSCSSRCTSTNTLMAGSTSAARLT